MIDVVGIGAEGLDSLSQASRELLGAADVVVGGRRQLALLPSTTAHERVAWPSPLLPALPALLKGWAGRRVVVLASGDPLVAGVGSSLLRLAGPGEVRVHPAVSSVALARARLGWPAQSCDVVSLVSAAPQTIARWLVPGARLIVLSAGAHTPAALADLLRESGWGAARLVVLGDLGGETESRQDATADTYDPEQTPALNLVAIELGPHPGLGFALGTTPGLPDDAFEHDGQLTKWELRIAALARLRPVPGQLLWDLGAGSGSVGIEWARTHPRCRVVAVEHDPARAARIGRNAAALGVPQAVEVRRATVGQALAELPDPDAVFVGGGATADVLATAWSRLAAGGRLVAHAVTLQTEAVLVAAQARWGGELRRLGVDRAAPLGGRFLSWTPARPVVQWAAVKPAVEPAVKPAVEPAAEPVGATPSATEPGAVERENQP